MAELDCISAFSACLSAELNPKKQLFDALAWAMVSLDWDDKTNDDGYGCHPDSLGSISWQDIDDQTSDVELGEPILA